MFHAGAAASILRAARQAKVKAKETTTPKRKGSTVGSRRPSAAGGRSKSTTQRKKIKPKNARKLQKRASSLSMLSRDDDVDSALREFSTPSADRLNADGATVFSPEEAETLYQIALDLQEAKRMLTNHSEVFTERLDTVNKV
ncbi:uncharacterized protein LOC135483874 [Lineus longissimus]|uniref:uncharacterized protein LOC135483874 n=1 Tax=Lineus longissimus TaxID=88925 RepID=UPI00315CACDD